jgi:hypothetical protein
MDKSGRTTEEIIGDLANRIATDMGELLTDLRVQKSHRLKPIMTAFPDLVNLLRWLEDDLRRGKQ